MQSGCYTPAVTTAERLHDALDAESEVQLAVLFGSTARGTGGPTSDLDVGVLGVSGDRLGQVEANLSRALGRQVDLVALETAPPLLRFEIARDGAMVIERAAHAWSDFRARAMVDWWDWSPLARRFHHAAANRLHAQVPRGPA
jgi:predicted nucleotidyltransferase